MKRLTSFILILSALLLITPACQNKSVSDPNNTGNNGGSGGNGGNGGSGGNTGGDHAHFDSEKSKPGVVASVSWRNQAEIDRDSHGSNDPGDPAYPLYDPTEDAAKLPILSGEPLQQLRLEFPFTSGSVWTQHEIMLHPVLFTEVYTPYGMKLWRWEDDSKQECTDERRLTMNVGFDEAPHVYHRDGCPIPEGEVRLMTSGGVWDEQPGGETSALWGENTPHPQCFRWAPGVWVRMTYHFDFAGKTLNIWAQRFDEERVYKIVEFAVPDWNGNYGFKTAGAWLHSTSRTHDNWATNLPPAYVYARNQIISTEPITF